MKNPICKLEQGMLDEGIIRAEPELVVEPFRVVMARNAVTAQLRRSTEDLALKSAATKAPRTPWVPPAPESRWVQHIVGWSVGALFVGTLFVGAFVPMERVQNTHVELGKYKLAATVLVCADGYSVAMNPASIWTWVTGGSSLVCTDWETPEGRDARALAKAEAAAKKAEAEK